MGEQHGVTWISRSKIIKLQTLKNFDFRGTTKKKRPKKWERMRRKQTARDVEGSRELKGQMKERCRVITEKRQP